MTQVWFQNRRAKWRRQEKMEASQQLRKFQQEFSTSMATVAPLAAHQRPTGANSFGPVAHQLDHWLTSPLLGAYHAAAAAHAAAAYPSYLSSLGSQVIMGHHVAAAAAHATTTVTTHPGQLQVAAPPTPPSPSSADVKHFV